jgi:hypothetical protein
MAGRAAADRLAGQRGDCAIRTCVACSKRMPLQICVVYSQRPLAPRRQPEPVPYGVLRRRP